MDEKYPETNVIKVVCDKMTKGNGMGAILGIQEKNMKE